MISNLRAAELSQSSSKSFQFRTASSKSLHSKNLQYSLKKKFVSQTLIDDKHFLLRQRQVYYMSVGVD